MIPPHPRSTLFPYTTLFRSDFTVTDHNGCVTHVTGTISEPGALSASETHDPIGCFGGTTTVNITASGGTSPYDGDGAHTNVAAGPFDFTVTDHNGCVTHVTGTISQPPALGASETHNPIGCYGGTTTVNITASGSTPAHDWDRAHTKVPAPSFDFNKNHYHC